MATGVTDDTSLDAWYQRERGHDTPVLLVDMAPLNAWVTSVKTGRVGGSRLNFLSAVVSVDIASARPRPMALRGRHRKVEWFPRGALAGPLLKRCDRTGFRCLRLLRLPLEPITNDLFQIAAPA
jgi:hypothetical protein